MCTKIFFRRNFMKKFTKVLALTLVAIMCLAFFAGCGVNENTAERINKAAEEEKYLTYEELVKSYGAPTVDWTASFGDSGKTGFCAWVNGCKTKEDLQAKQDAGQKLQALYVTFVGGQATSAEYKEYTGEEK